MDDLFVKLKGKVRVGKQTFTQEELDDPLFTSDYGRLVQMGFAFFDFDEQPYIDIITKIIEHSGLKCKMLQTTRGVHFLFKTNKDKVTSNSKHYNWLGLRCDIKGVGLKEAGKQCYQAIRVNGKLRAEIALNYDESLGISALDYAPKWLYQASRKRQIDLTEDQEGGRNDMFHGEMMIECKKAGFTYEEYCQVARMINNEVLPSGLSEEELNTAIRQEEWDKLAIGEDELKLIDKAQDAIDYWDCMVCNNQIMFYHEALGRFSSNVDTIRCYIQEKYSHNNITTNQIEEVLGQMGLQLRNHDKYKKERNNEYVICKDELVSMWNDKTMPLTRTIVTDIYYPYKVMTNAEYNKYDGIGKKFIDDITCENPEIKTVLSECLGCMLAPVSYFGKIFVWYGSGANGKSLLLKLMKKIMGDKMTAANILAINDSFGLQNVAKGICNVTDDVGTSVIRETGLLKSVIDGSEVEVNMKYQAPIMWKPTSQFIMCCNEIPRIADSSVGMIRRMSFIPFDMKLRQNEIDYFLYDKISGDEDAMRYIMTTGIRGFRNAVKAGHLTDTERQTDLIEDYKEENKDQVVSFYEYMLDEKGYNTLGRTNEDYLCKWLGDGVTTDEVYRLYTEWCKANLDNRVKPQREFTRKFKQLLPARMFVKKQRIAGLVMNVYAETK